MGNDWLLWLLSSETMGNFFLLFACIIYILYDEHVWHMLNHSLAARQGFFPSRLIQWGSSQGSSGLLSANHSSAGGTSAMGTIGIMGPKGLERSVPEDNCVVFLSLSDQRPWKNTKHHYVQETLRCSFKHYAIQDAVSYIPFLPMSHNELNPIMWHWDMVCPISLAWDMGQTMEAKQEAQAVKGSFSGAPSLPRPHPSWWAQRLRHLGWAVGKVTKALQTTAITSSRDSK